MDQMTQQERQEAIRNALRERASEYFPELRESSTNIKSLRTTERVFSSLYEFEIAADKARRRVVVKVTAMPEDVTQSGFPLSIPEKYRPTPDPKGYEYAAMCAIERHVTGLGDSRFGAVRVLDQWFDGWAIVMEHMPHASLATRLRKCRRGRIASPDLAPAFHNAGAWLAEFHRMQPPAHTANAVMTRDSFVDEIRTICELIGSISKHAARFGNINSNVAEKARSILPAELPVGVAHDDYAPRNVLVGPRDKVFVIDTLAERRAAIYNDIAHFLVSVKTNKLQLLSRGLAFANKRIDEYEKAFLCGYFGDEIPHEAVRLFELKAMLTRWLTLQLARPTTAGFDRLKYDAYLALAIPFVQQHISRATADLGFTPPSSSRAHRTSERLAIIHALGNNADKYFAQLADAEVAVTLDAVRSHRFSRIYRATLSSSDRRRKVIVKVPKNAFDSVQSSRFSDRPRLEPLLCAEEEARLEFAALLHIDAHFRELNKPMLRAVRTLEFMPQYGAIIVEAIEAPTLKTLLKGCPVNGTVKAVTDIVFAFERAGQWLRILHELPETEHAVPRHATRAEWLDNVRQYTNFIAQFGDEATFMRSLHNKSAAFAEQEWPESLPLALAHGDYAPHNIFVCADGSVAAFDTLGNWKMPIFMDLAHFLFVLRKLSGTLAGDKSADASAELYERAFLAGYFAGGSIPTTALNLFYLLILLDKWASDVQSRRRAGGLKWMVKSIRLPRRVNVYRRAVRQLLDEMNTSSDDSANNVNLRDNMESALPCH